MEENIDWVPDFGNPCAAGLEACGPGAGVGLCLAGGFTAKGGAL